MSVLTDKQAKFAVMSALLILHANQLGYRVRLGEAWRHPSCTHVKKRRLHSLRLAIDLILDKKENGKWVWQKDTESYRELGKYWESIGGSWGGRFGDGNHFSLAHRGMK